MLTSAINPAWGCRTRSTCVSSSPSKIPYGGFSPVRLQTGIRPRSSTTHPGSHPVPQLIRGPSHSLSGEVGFTPVRSRAQRHPSGTPLLLRRPSRPEALGSPAGYAVLPGHRLLWPHPRLSPPPADLCFRRRVFALRSNLGGKREGPHFTLLVCILRAAFRTPVDRTTALGCCFIIRCGLPHLCTRSASTFPRAPALAWKRHEAAKFTLGYGPEELLALHRPGRLRSSFHLLSRLKKASNITTRVNSQFPRLDLHQQDKQPYGLQAKALRHEKRKEKKGILLCVLCDLGPAGAG